MQTRGWWFGAAARAMARISGVAAGVIAASAVALTAVPAAAAVPSPASPGTFGLRLLDDPSQQAAEPEQAQYIVDHVRSGSVVQRRIQVVNDSGLPHRLAVYPAAATVVDRQFRFGDGHAVNELTGWTRLGREVLDLPAHHSDIVRVRIEVPPDASPGARYGVVWAELGSPAAGGVHLVNRVGVRIYLDVGDGGRPAVDFAVAPPTARRLPDGRIAVSTEVHNTGGRPLTVSGEVDLRDGPGGIRGGPFVVPSGPVILPGWTAPVTAVLDGRTPAGPWTAAVTLRTALVSRVALGPVRFPPAAGGAGRGADRPGPGFGSFAVVLSGLFGLVVLLAARMYRRRPAVPVP